MYLVARNIKVVLTAPNHYKTWHILASPPSWSCDVRKSLMAAIFLFVFVFLLWNFACWNQLLKLQQAWLVPEAAKAQREDKHLAKPASLHITLTNWAPAQISAYLKASNMQRPFMWSKGNKLLARCHPDCPIVGWLADVTVFRNLIMFTNPLASCQEWYFKEKGVWIIFPRVERSNE